MALFLSSKIHQSDDLSSKIHQSDGTDRLVKKTLSMNNIFILIQGDRMYLQFGSSVWLCCLRTWCRILICRYNFT
jgi:hypothetical protein